MNHAQSLFHVLATLAAVIAVGQFCVGLCRRLGQPAVIGQVIAGIALGPSLLGWVAPQLQAALIPTPHADPRGLVVGSLHAISQLGIVLSMFLVGVEFNLVRFRQHARSAIAVAAGSTLIPGLAGFLLALWLHPRMCDESVARSSFSLFMGVAMAITAFPILARILVDRRLETADLGVLAPAAAALADVAAWCMLAMVVGVVQARAQAGILVCLGAALFIAAMF
ncbi:MAG: cation:proton antiporter, partial [Planctomycetaceae bacterium]